MSNHKRSPLIFSWILFITMFFHFLSGRAPAEDVRDTANEDPSHKNQEISGKEAFEFTIQVSLVNLFTTVYDEKGKIVKGLKKEDFLLWEDEKTQDISHFTTFKKTPLSLAILLDLSGSMAYQDKLKNSRKIIKAIADSLEKNDEIALFTFSDYFVKKKVPFTKDKSAIIKKLKSLKAGGNTALYQAISFMPEILGENQNRQAILLLTDGLDNKSIISQKQVIENTAKMQIPIYVIGFAYTGKKDGHRLDKEYSDPEVIETLASETGGFFKAIMTEEELHDTIENMKDELRFQYVIGYRSNQNSQHGTYHTIKLITKNTDYRVNVRKGYQKK